jgi:hypothetical protein
MENAGIRGSGPGGANGAAWREKAVSAKAKVVGSFMEKSADLGFITKEGRLPSYGLKVNRGRSQDRLVQQFPQFLRQRRRRVRLLQKCHAFVQYALVNVGILGVCGCEKNLGVRVQ